MLSKLALFAVLLACLVPLAAAKDKKKDKEKFQTGGPVQLDKDGDKWARNTLKKMSTEEKIGQLIMIWCRAEFLNIKDPEYVRMRDTMKKYHIIFVPCNYQSDVTPLNNPAVRKNIRDYVLRAAN